MKESSAIGWYEKGSEESDRFGHEDGFGGFSYMGYSVCVDFNVEKVS